MNIIKVRLAIENKNVKNRCQKERNKEIKKEGRKQRGGEGGKEEREKKRKFFCKNRLP